MANGHRTAMIIVGMLIVLVSGLSLLQNQSSAYGASSHKKVCRTVKKHGRKTKVCHQVKPEPTSTDLPDPTVTPVEISQGSYVIPVVRMAITGLPPPPPVEQIQEWLSGDGNPTTREDSVQTFFRAYGIGLTFTYSNLMTLDAQQDTATPCSADDVQSQYKYAVSQDPSLKSFHRILILDSPHGTSCPEAGQAVAASGDAATPRPAIIFDAYGPSVLKHELGHTFGLEHDGTLAFSPDPYTYTPDAFNAQNEYGNTDSIMSSGDGGLSIVVELALGYLSPNQVQTVQTSGDYMLFQREDNSPGTHVLRIPKQDFDANIEAYRYRPSWYIEYQTNAGEDAHFGAPGLNVMLWDGWILPGGETDAVNWRVAKLQTTGHSTFTDPVNHITITFRSQTVDTATVHVEYSTG